MPSQQVATELMASSSAERERQLALREAQLEERERQLAEQRRVLREGYSLLRTSTDRSRSAAGGAPPSTWPPLKPAAAAPPAAGPDHGAGVQRLWNRIRRSLFGEKPAFED
jgi:hypothetical protein